MYVYTLQIFSPMNANTHTLSLSFDAALPLSDSFSADGKMLGGRRISVCLARERFIIKEGNGVKGMRRSTLSRAVSCFFRALAAARNGFLIASRFQ